MISDGMSTLIAAGTAIAISVASVVRGEFKADSALDAVSKFEQRYTSTQTEFRELQKDVSDIAVRAAILETKIDASNEDLKIIREYIKDLYDLREKYRDQE